MKQCTKCKIIKHNWEFGPDKRHSDRLQCQCRKCMNVNAKIYQKTEKGKLARKSRDRRYDKSEKGKAHYRKYAQTENGSMVRAKNGAKFRGLNWILMFPNPFADNVKVDYHHITDAYVVAVPRDLHRLFIQYENHRDIMMNIVKQIYLV